MNPPPVRMLVEWNVWPQQGRGMLSALQSLMTSTRREPGCLWCSLETEAGEHVTIRLREHWETEGDLRRHVQSEHFVMLARLIESATESPLIRFELPAGTRGVDWAQEVRHEATA